MILHNLGGWKTGYMTGLALKMKWFRKGESTELTLHWGEGAGVEGKGGSWDRMNPRVPLLALVLI